MDSDDAERRAAECLALSSIYENMESEDDNCWRLPLDAGAVLEVHVPVDYPSTSPPTPVLQAPFITDSQREELVSEMLAQYDGAEVVFTWCEFLRERLLCLAADSLSLAAAVEAQAAEVDLDLHHSDTLNAVGASGAAVGGDADMGWTFTPATNKYGQRVRHFDASAEDGCHEVEIASGPPFHPPKSGPGESVCHALGHMPGMQSRVWACLSAHVPP